MQTFTVDTDVTIAVPFVDANGAAVPAAGLTLAYQVLDEIGNVLLDVTALPNPSSGDQSVNITVPRAYNLLGGPRPNGVGNPIQIVRGLREIRLLMTTAAGVLVNTNAYMIQVTDSPLVLMQNSFQSYNMALMTGAGLAGLSGWLTAAPGDRVNAMVMAWTRLTSFGYYVRWPRDPDAQNQLRWLDARNEIIIPRIWSLISTDRWLTYYPEVFRQAMRDAQVTEADAILTNDPLQQRRDAGIMMEKIGESTIMFRNRIPLDLGVSKATLRCVKGFIDYKFTMTRG